LDAKELMESLTLEQVKVLLTELGAQHISDVSENKTRKEDLITNTICHNISDGNMKLYYYHDSRYFHCYTKCGENFNIFGLVIKNHALKGVTLKFPEAISWICLKLGIKQTMYEKPDGFGHVAKGNSELEYYKKFDKKKMPEAELIVHDEKIFYMFSNHHHQSFLEDGINHEAMNKFEVMFDYVKHSVVVPHRKHDDGSLIGIKVRNLDQWKIDNGIKYVPLKVGESFYSYPTYANLYGYWQNKETIKRLKKIIIFESEKSVLQIEAMFPNNNWSVAICGSNLSQFQVELILNLGVEEVILALDKENSNTLDEKSILYQEKLLRMGRMLAPYVRTMVIYDDNGLLDLKDSPSDKGKDVLLQLLENKKEVFMKEEL